MTAIAERPREIAQIDIPPAQTVSQTAWETPRLRRLDLGMSEATPGGNAEGDGTS
jgi:hypothetical protein